MTTGGTESILLACKTYREYANEVKGIKKPNVVLPITAHTAFEKAAQYLNLKLRYVPVNPQSLTVCMKSMEKAITRNTIMVRAMRRSVSIFCKFISQSCSNNNRCNSW